jgi:outer membrane receptor protein involved in Fe transport
LNVQASLLHTYVRDETEVKNAAAGTHSVFTPTLIASYKPWQETDVNFRAFYKRIFRLPTFNDLYYTFIGNKFLKPEYTTQYNVGVTYSRTLESRWLPQFDVQVDAYYNEVEDKIVAIPADNQFRWTMLNFGYVEIRGIDVALHGQWQAGNVHGGARLSYTYQKAQDFTNPTGEWYGHQISYIPWHSGAAIVNADWKMWSFNYSFIYTGERYARAANIPENYSPAWYTHDLSASWSGKLSGAALKITAEVNNLLNQPYEVVQWYPMPGTNFKLILNVTL